MENTVMTLTPEHFQQIGDYVKSHIHEWVGEPDMVLRERVIRVEESIKNQMALMQQGFDRMEKRFKQVDKRFEQMDKRFEKADRRFEEQRADMNARFAEQREDTAARFDRMDRRFNLMFSMLSGLILTCLAGFIIVIINTL